MPEKRTKTQVEGVVEIAIAIGIFMWARTHSPNMGFGEMMTKPDSYMLNQPEYYVGMIITALFAIGGAISLFKNLQIENKPDEPFAKCVGKKISIPWYCRSGWLTTAVLCVGPLAIPLFWLNPNFTLHKKIIWTAVILIITWVAWIAMQKSIQSIKDFYGILDQLN